MRAFTLREVTVPVLPAGSEPLRILHLSDAHLTPSQHRKQRVAARRSPTLEPDLVVNTGDNLAHMRCPARRCSSAYGDLLDLPGVFVFGSNDYYSPILKNPARYLLGGTGTAADRNAVVAHAPARPPVRADAPRLHRPRLDRPHQPHASLDVAGRRLAFVGVDDPHLGTTCSTTSRPTRRPTSRSASRMRPYLRVLDRWNALGYPLILAGHTHGGQLCVPGSTGRSSPTATSTASAPRACTARRSPGHEPSWLHVSAGLGTSPFAPVRFACRPEATLLTLTGIDSPGLPA